MIVQSGIALQRKLASMRNWWRTTHALSGLAWTLGVVVFLCLICYHVDRVTGGLSATAREAWRAAILLIGLATLAIGALRPLLRSLPDEALARDVERRYPALRERLLTTVNLIPALNTSGNTLPVPATDPGFSRPLMTALIEETRQVVANLDFCRAVNLHPLRVATIVLGVSLSVLLADYLRAPDAFRNWINRMIYVQEDIAPWADTRVWLSPEKSLLPRGEALQVTVRTQGAPAERATLRYRLEGDPADTWKTVELTARNPRQVRTDSVEREFVYRFPALEQTVTLKAQVNDGQSNERVVRVEDRPALLNMRLRLRFPAYMKKPDQTIAETTGNIVAPVGTQVDVEAIANKPLQSAHMVQDGNPTLPWKVENDRAFGKLAVWRDGRYRLDLTDRNGFRNTTTTQYEIRALKDQTPDVQIQRPATDVELVPNGSVPLVARASDDYGIARMHLVYEKGRSDAYRGTTGARSSHGALPLPGPNGTPVVTVSQRWNIASVNPQPGDILTYHVTATDTDTLNGPHVGRSASYRVRVVSLLEMQRKLKDQLDEEARLLAQLRARQIDAQRTLRAARVRPEPGRIAQAQEAERAVAQEARALAQRVESLSAQLENNNLATRSELERRDQAQQQLQDLASTRIPQAADTIQRAQNARPNSPAQQADLQQADRQETGIRQEIEQTQNLLARTPSPQQLAREAQRLAQEQQRLADSARYLAEDMRGHRQQTGSRALTPEQQAGMEMERRQQADVTADSRRLQQQLERAAREARERGNTQVADALQRAARAMQQGNVSGNQQQAQQALQRNDPGAAASPQDRAAAALERAAQAAEKAGQQATPDSAQAAAERLEQAADRLRGMAREQREIAQRVAQNPGAPQSRQLGQRERGLEQQAGQMQSQLRDAQAAQQALQNAQQSLDQSAQRLQQGDARAAQSPAQQAARQLEQAAQAAQQAAQQLRQQQAAQELAEKVERLARVQRAVQQATRRLNNSRRDGLDDNEQRELGQIAERQQQLERQARDIALQFPSPAFQQALDLAARQMQPATQNLNQSRPDTGEETQQAQNRAAQTLETVARALQQQAGNPDQQQNGQQPQNQPNAQQAQQQAALGDLALAQGLQQQLRQETGALDRARQSNPDQALTPRQRQQAEGLTRNQRATRDITRSAGQQLGQMPGVGQAIQEATRQMEQAADRLGQQQTGRPTQGHQDNAIASLDQAIRQAQQQMQQQQQQQMAQQNSQQGMPQPNQQPGNQPPRRAFTRLENPRKGPMSSPDPRAGRFADLDVRTQRTLREGQQERAPAEYQELVHRYYRALAERQK